MFWLFFVICVPIFTFWIIYRVDNEIGWGIVFALLSLVAAVVVAGLIGAATLPAICNNFAKTTTVVLEDKELLPVDDSNYIRICDIGYDTFHYTLREKVNDGTYRDFTINSYPYFDIAYNNKDYHYIVTKTTFSNPILKFFTIYWEKNITIIIPPHSITVEDTTYVEP